MGYQIQSIEEAERMIRNVGLYAAAGIAAAETVEQKQFVLERIIIELGMSLPGIRQISKRVVGEVMIGEPFDLLDEIMESWRDSEEKRYKGGE